MPETLIPPRQSETMAAPEQLNMLISDEFATSRNQWITNSLNGEHDVSMLHVKRLFERSEIKREDAYQAWENGGRLKEHDRHMTQEDKLRETAYRTFGADTVKEYYRLGEAQHNLGKDTLDFWGPEADKLVSDLLTTSPLINDGIDRQHELPPAARESADPGEFLDYLGRKLFIDPALFNRSRNQAHRKLRLMLDEPVQIPVANVVSAGGFDSWQGRGKGGKADKNYTNSEGVHLTGRSINAIIDYAKRPTDLPSLEGIVAYVQPNGVTIYEVDVSNHRMAAAIARGQETVAVDNIVIVSVDHNFVEAKQ